MSNPTASTNSITMTLLLLPLAPSSLKLPHSTGLKKYLEVKTRFIQQHNWHHPHHDGSHRVKIRAGKRRSFSWAIPDKPPSQGNSVCVFLIPCAPGLLFFPHFQAQACALLGWFLKEQECQVDHIIPYYILQSGSKAGGNLCQKQDPRCPCNLFLTS